MSRRLPVVAACLLAPLLARAGPPTAPAPDVPWLPVGVGDRLVMEETRPGPDGPATRLITRTVVAAERGSDSLLVCIREEKPGLTDTLLAGEGRATTESKVEMYRQTRAGVYLVARDLQVFDPPCCVGRLPLKAGDTWEVNNPAIWPHPIKYTTGKEEEVEVPAGKFKATRIEKKGVLRDGTTVRVTEWVAPSVGVVKARARLQDGTAVVQVLKSVTPAKR